MLEPASLRRRISAVFQDFMAYDFTAADNIGLGSLDRLGDQAALRSTADVLILDEPSAGLDAQVEHVALRREPVERRVQGSRRQPDSFT